MQAGRRLPSLLPRPPSTLRSQTHTTTPGSSLNAAWSEARQQPQQARRCHAASPALGARPGPADPHQPPAGYSCPPSYRPAWGFSPKPCTQGQRRSLRRDGVTRAMFWLSQPNSVAPGRVHGALALASSIRKWFRSPGTPCPARPCRMQREKRTSQETLRPRRLGLPGGRPKPGPLFFPFPCDLKFI